LAFDGYDCEFKYIDSALVHIADIQRVLLSKS